MSDLERLLLRSDPSSLGVFGFDEGGEISAEQKREAAIQMEELSRDLFEPAATNREPNRISRPSISYWQDAWIRLKGNRQAFVSLLMISFLLLFTLTGSFVWNDDPAAQELTRTSEVPSFGRLAVVLGELTPYEETVVEGVPESPDADPSSLSASAALEVIAPPTVQSVRLQWKPVTGAAGYAVYRADFQPRSAANLGLPIADLQGGNKVSYQDQFNLVPGQYFYTVVAKNRGQESTRFSTLKVDLASGVQLEEAQKFQLGVKPGDQIKLPAHPLGTDYLGRDILARVIQGGRVSLFIGLVAPLLATVIGLLLGGISGFFGGRIDEWLMRITDFVMALPFLLFMILFKVVSGTQAGESGVAAMLVAMIFLSWTGPARLARGQILQLRESEFIQAARLMGARPAYMILRHLMPNTLGVILVSLTFSIPTAIFTEAFLSFVGMGVVPPMPSWGSMCNEGIQSFLTHPHEFIFPALLISGAVLAFNLLGDGLRDALDPKLRAR